MFNGIIRPLREADVQSVEQIFDLYWNDDFRHHLTDKLRKYIHRDPSLAAQHFEFFVAEENGTIVGIAALRKAPEHMLSYASTNNPAELYVATVKEQARGIGTALALERIQEAQKEGYTEVLLFSGVKHQDAWKFHDKHFERVGSATAPNGENGYIWRKLF